MKTWDVIIIGGGIIGLSLALELRKQGASVLVVDKGEPGRESSYAAAGMLVDSPLETRPALQPLAAASARLYPEFVHEIQMESELKVYLRDKGALVFLAQEEVAEYKAGARFVPEALSPEILAKLEPAIAAPNYPAFFLQERSVDPRALSTAAHAAAKRRGVDFSSGDAVTAVNLPDGQISGISAKKTSFLSSKVVNCAGAWSGQIGPYPFPTRPAKGQMLCLLSPRHELIQHVIRTPEVYLTPRSDGRILAGATVEDAGFDKRTDIETIQRLHRAALTLVPELRNGKILEDWAGLRPRTPDSLPILGATATPGYYVATGHFRDGILLAPITAQVMARVLAGNPPEYDLSAFSPDRFVA